jgi:hypothetical protein
MVTSYAELVARELKPHLSAAAQEYFGFVLDGTDRMKVLIDDLLGYATVAGSRRS